MADVVRELTRFDDRVGVGAFWKRVGLLVAVGLALVIALRWIDAGPDAILDSEQWAASRSPLGRFLELLLDVVFLVPWLSICVRRLHDHDHTGWWLWLVLIPVLGWIPLFYWLGIKPGEPDWNQYGEPGDLPVETMSGAQFR